MSAATRVLTATGLAGALVAVRAPAAHAYPQFQLSNDQTCSGCHLSPAGGGLLSENGFVTAESISQLGTAPELFYNKVPTPTWLELGGDLRAAAGLDAPSAHDDDLVWFPMQAELEAAVTVQSVSLHVTAGFRDPQYDNTAATLFSSREHWLQWQQHPGQSAGWYVRVGRFMPVFGLRFAEHPDFDRRYGGTPLYGEAYGAAVEYVDPEIEVHATAFVHDPFFPDSVERGNGAAVYAEARVAATTALGVEGKLDVTPDDRHEYVGAVAKHWFAGAGLLVQGEVQVVHQKVDLGGTNLQLVGYALGSYTVGHGVMIDLGLGGSAPDLRVRELDQEAVDVNVHWFATSHVELIWTNRFETIGLGTDGPSAGYSLLQLHYRL